MSLKLNSRVNEIKGVGPKYLQIFEKNNILTVLDLLLHFPVLYMDFSNPSREIAPGEKRLYKVEIINFNLSRGFRRRLSVLRVNAKLNEELNEQKILLVFFNQPYLENFFKVHRHVFIYGTIDEKEGILQSNTPVVFSEEDAEKDRVLPLYNRLGTIKTGKLKQVVTNCLEKLRDGYEFLPKPILDEYMFPSMTDALQRIHFPPQYDEGVIERLKQRFIYAEFLLFQMELQFIRDFFKQVRRLHEYSIPENVMESIKEILPFQLTPDQWKAFEEIAADLRGGFTMQRLLQGDVGVGKTVVAFMALWLAARSGVQGAFLAPTEILARQHYANAQKFFNSARIEILTGSTTAKERKRILKELEKGEIDIIFGTHALLNEKVKFRNLSMVVIDEQHRFGVSQRAALYYKGKSVDLLVTTATPIPRTMLLSLYNDLGVSVIKTKPQGRLPIETKIIDGTRRDEFYRWLRNEIEKGNKAYIILPLIEDSEFFPELRSIESEKDYFKSMFKGFSVGIISGRHSPEEKDRVIGEFAEGKHKVLVSTTVIEVGIDVRDATMMVIENADRYGLSQLHQLRGRVGRGELQSSCYLFGAPNMTENGKRRLTTIASTTDGFKIAETDLKMRGGGIITGFDQSGYLDFKVGNLQDDIDLFKIARTDASKILENDSYQNDFIKDHLTRIQCKLNAINFS